MRQITVSLFRLTFPSLTEPHEVTLSGRVIGEYRPRTAPTLVRPTLVRPIPKPEITQRAER